MGKSGASAASVSPKSSADDRATVVRPRRNRYLLERPPEDVRTSVPRTTGLEVSMGNVARREGTLNVALHGIGGLESFSLVEGLPIPWGHGG